MMRVCIQVWANIYIQRMQMFLCMHTSMSKHLNTYTYEQTFTCKCWLTLVCMQHLHVNVCSYLYVCKCLLILVCIHAECKCLLILVLERETCKHLHTLHANIYIHLHTHTSMSKDLHTAIIYTQRGTDRHLINQYQIFA